MPEKYTLTVPEDGKAFLDDTDLPAFAAAAREAGLSNAEAQELVNDRAVALKNQSAAFRTQLEADPTYGGEHLADTQRRANLLLDKLRPAGTVRGDAFRKLLTKTGYFNHPEVYSFLVDAADQIAEDRPIGGPGSGGGAAKSATDLYDHPTSKALG